MSEHAEEEGRGGLLRSSFLYSWLGSWEALSAAPTGHRGQGSGHLALPGPLWSTPEHTLDFFGSTLNFSLKV